MGVQIAQYMRSSYIPTVVASSAYTGAVTPTIYLDFLNAYYLDMFNQITVYTNFMITHSSEGRLDIISNKFYGIPDLWWIIGMYNGIINPIFEIKVGINLRIPDRNQVDTLLQISTQPSNSSTTVDLL